LFGSTVSEDSNIHYCGSQMLPLHNTKIKGVAAQRREDYHKRIRGKTTYFGRILCACEI